MVFIFNDILLTVNIKGALTSKPYAFNARSWELKTVNSIDVFETYGCFIRYDYRDREILRVIPRNDFWISDRTRFFYDGLKYNRLQYPLIRKNKAFISISWIQVSVFLAIFFKLNNLNLDIDNFIKKNFELGNFLDLESLFSFKRFLVRHIKPFTEGSLSFFGKYIASTQFLGSADLILPYIFSTKASNIRFDQFNLLLFIGFNARLDNPVLNALIRKYSSCNEHLSIFSVGSAYNYTYHVKSLGCRMHKILQIFRGKDSLSSLFFHRNVLILNGSSFITRIDAGLYSSLLESLQRLFSSCSLKHNQLCIQVVESISTNLNATFLGLKGSTTMLSYIKDKNAELTGDLQLNYFWNSEKNKSILNLFSPLRSTKNTFNIYQGHHYDPLIDTSDVILPSSTFVEKSGTYITLSGSLNESKRIYFPPKNARVDWQIFQFLSYITYIGSLNTFLKVVDLNDLQSVKYKIQSLRYNLHDLIQNLYATYAFKFNEQFTLFETFENQSALRKELYTYIFTQFRTTTNLNLYKSINSGLSWNRQMTFHFNNTSLISFLNSFFSLDVISRSSLTLQMRARLERQNFKNFINI